MGFVIRALLCLLPAFAWGVEVRPLIQGTFDDGTGPGTGCWITNQCTSGGLVPWGGQIDVTGASGSSTVDYVRLQGVEVNNALGRGLSVKNTRWVVIDSVRVDFSARASLILERSHAPVTRNSEASRGGICHDRMHMGARYTDCPDRPGNWAIVRGKEIGGVGGLIENVFSHSSIAEGVSIGRQSGGAIIRANRVADLWSSHIYANGCGPPEMCVVERNIIGSRNFAQSGFARFGGDISVSSECMPGGTNCSQSDPSHPLIRNNIFASAERALDISIQSGQHATELPEVRVSARFYGNTVAYSRSSALFRSWNQASVDFLDVQNNLFYGASGDCESSISSVAVTTFAYNGWQANPGVTKCRNSVGGFVGDPDWSNDSALQGNYLYGLGYTPTDSMITTSAAAELNGGSPAINSGNPALRTSTCLDVSNFPNWGDIEFDPPTEAEWEACLALDFDGVTRGSLPDIGAVEN